MVKALHLAFLVFVFSLSFAQGALAAGESFTASLNRDHVGEGESFVLALRLSGTSPKETPDLSPLDQDFKIFSTGQTSQTSIINGKISSIVGWNVILIPKKTGTLTIPALSIESDAGRFTSDPVQIYVGEAAADSQGGGKTGRPVFVKVEASQTEPFKNQPVLLTVKLVALRDVSDIRLGDLAVPHAVVEQQGDPQVYDAVTAGKPAKVVEVRYLITPLQDGDISIPGLTFDGQIDSGQRQNPFGRLGGFADPFGMMDDLGGFPGMTAYTPFAVAAQDITLHIKPAAMQMDPWLPAEKVALLDEWTGAEHAKVGEPLTRKITMTAKGTSGAALPSLEGQIDPAGDFKLYADKPASGDKISPDGKSIAGWRAESFTLIPQKPGELTLPEIKLAWWDTINGKIAYATIPQKTIIATGQALPSADVSASSAPAGQSLQVPEKQSADVDTKQVVPSPEQSLQSLPGYLYGLIGVLALAVVFMGALLVYLLRTLAKEKKAHLSDAMKKVQTPLNAANEDKVSLSVISKAESAEDLRIGVQRYAHHHFGLPLNASLQIIAGTIKRDVPEADVAVFSTLDSALYAGGQIDLDDVKGKLVTLFKTAKSQNHEKNSPEKKWGTLNPS
ncbi:MAG: protein BatD [Alphaproteobacteria bacterium]|nr:protein BatD [Alphaproteobacteria bacterium]